MSKVKALLFQPFAGIWPHSVQELRIALGASNEFEISYLGCGALYDTFCTVRESRGRQIEDLSSRLKIDCLDCKFSSSIVGKSVAGLDNSRRSSLSEFFKESDAIDVEKVMDRIDFERFSDSQDFKFMGIPVVRISVYETLLKYKKRNLDFTAEQIQFQRTQTKNVLKTIIAAHRYFESHSFESILIYSPQYAINNAFAHVANMFGIRTLFLEGSSSNSERNQRVRVWNWQVHGLSNPAIETWSSRDLSDVPEQNFDSVNAHLEATEKGLSHSVYSKTAKAKTAIRRILSIPLDQEIFVCALSSYDESYAAYVIGAFPKQRFISAVFVDQFEWVKATIEWASVHPDICLVIRLHPRDLPNRRDPMRSQQVDKWETILVDLPGNVRIDHPSEQIPITSYWGQARVWITGWSSTAIEAMSNGIPALTYDKGLASFPSAIHFSGNSIQEYFANLDSLVGHRLDPDSIRITAKSWLSFNFEKGTIPVSQSRAKWLARIIQRPIISKLNTALYLGLFPLYRTFSVFKALISKGIDSSSAARLNSVIAGRSNNLFEQESAG